MAAGGEGSTRATLAPDYFEGQPSTEETGVRPKLYQPYRLQVRLYLFLAWAAIALGVIIAGSRSLERNPPVGLLLLGLGLAGSGLLATLTLASAALWDRLVDPEFDVRTARIHLYWVVALGVLGAVMMGFALNRLL